MEREAAAPASESFAALIVGVTGMVGLSLAEALKRPDAPGGPWKVYGAARRPKPIWFPDSLVDQYIAFDAADSDDTRRHLSPFSDQITHLFWVALQAVEKEESRSSVNKAMLENVLATLLQSQTGASSRRLRHICLQTGTQYYMGPIHDPAFSSTLVPHAPPFREDMPRLPYPNFYYPLEDLVASHAPAVSYSVHRASIIIGASSRSVYNALLTLAAYASICRYEGVPLRFPGAKYAWEHFCDASDARVLAEQQVWAAVGSERAKNQAFNCTNGDVFTWRSFWKVLCEVFGVGFVEFDEKGGEFDFVGAMKRKGRVWDKIVEENGLLNTKLEEITCFEALDYALHFRFQHVSSMNKSRAFGFFGYADTLRSVGFWVRKLRSMRIIPQA